MKFTAALLALAAAVAAPLASAQCTGTNGAVIGNLTVTSSIKRTTVNGGSRIVQTVNIKNGGTSSAGNLKLSSTYAGTNNAYLKGSAKVSGASRVALTKETGLVASSGTTAITVPAGKTLKATLTWKADRCPSTTANANQFVWAAPVVSILNEAGCNKASSSGPTTVRVYTCNMCSCTKFKAYVYAHIYKTDLFEYL